MRKIWIVGSAIVVLTQTGCVATSPHWDAQFGEAARTLAAQQVIAPEASLSHAPVAGVDGKAAQGAINNYVKGFVGTEASSSPQVQTTINNFQ